MPITDLIPWKRSQESQASPLQTFQREMNQLFDDFMGLAPFRGFEERRGYSPRVDVVEDEKQITVSAELPGMDEKNVNLTLSHHVLTISGEKQEEHERKDKNCYYLERSFGSFQRSISLPCPVDADNVEASYKNGVLTIELPKTTESEKAKKINVKPA